MGGKGKSAGGLRPAEPVAWSSASSTVGAQGPDELRRDGEFRRARAIEVEEFGKQPQETGAFLHIPDGEQLFGLIHRDERRGRRRVRVCEAWAGTAGLRRGVDEVCEVGAGGLVRFPQLLVDLRRREIAIGGGIARGEESGELPTDSLVRR